MEGQQHGDRLKRGLKNRHIQLIALGGAIGTGLFLGSASVIQSAGPGIILGYAIAGFIAFLIMRQLGEMVVEEPVAGSFSHFAYKYWGGFAGFAPDACLINRYVPGAKLSLHQDKDEPDLRAPIVSVSLGLPAIFQFGGLKRNDPLKRLLLEHGDVVVWGGESRLFYHGIQPLKAGFHPLTTDCRYNLTFRQAGKKE